MSVYAKERPAYLALALQSLMNQTTPANQVVLVCDGPLTGDLDDVIDRFVEVLPLTLVRMPENRGLSHALNAGLPHCQYEWVARFDSDDLCERERFAKELAFAAAHPSVDVFGANIAEFSNDSTKPVAIRAVPTEHDKIANIARIRNPLNHVTVFFRKSVVQQAGGYPHYVQNEDYALWVELLRRGHRLANIPEVLVRVRAGREMVSRRGGLDYLLAELKLQNHFLRTGFIGPARYLFNVAVRIGIRLAPDWVRQKAYDSLLRTRP